MSDECNEIMATIRQQDAVDHADLLILVDEIERLRVDLAYTLDYSRSGRPCDLCDEQHPGQQGTLLCDACNARESAETERLRTELAECLAETVCQAAILSDTGWYDTMHRSYLIPAADRLVELGLWEVFPKGRFYRPLPAREDAPNDD